jgi:uncharacterized membrane protein YbhN (UPF0104 family)
MQVFGSVMMLAATLWFVDLVEIWQRLRQLQAAWLVLTLGILVMQFVLLAARWWWFARRLSAPLSYPQALREYFLAGLLNQILPFGILGDVSRAIRHARQTRQEARTSTRAPQVVVAILLERGSGQIALWVVAVAILPSWWQRLRTLLGPSVPLLLPGAASLLAIALVGTLVWIAWRTLHRIESISDLASASWRAMFSPASAAAHLPISFALVGTHVLAFVAVAHGLRLQLSLGLAVHVVPIALVVTTLPAFLAGWGIREATVAGLYHLAGLRSTDGVTIAILYGIVSLVASTPGLLVFSRASQR